MLLEFHELTGFSLLPPAWGPETRVGVDHHPAVLTQMGLNYGSKLGTRPSAASPDYRPVSCADPAPVGYSDRLRTRNHYRILGYHRKPRSILPHRGMLRREPVARRLQVNAQEKRDRDDRYNDADKGAS